MCEGTSDEVHRVRGRADGGDCRDAPALGPGEAARGRGGAGLDALGGALEAGLDENAGGDEACGDGLPVGEEVGHRAGRAGGGEGGGVEDV